MKIRTTLLSLTLCFGLGSLNAQTTSDFESFAVTDTFINGISNPLGYSFLDGNVAFENYYDTSFGGYWSGGFAISGVKDSTTQGFSNLYGCFPAEGASGSSNYAMGNNFSMAILNGNASGKMVDGLHITNSTFAVLSMTHGDNFAKKFGGADGNDPDWFKIEIFGQKDGVFTDTVEFYLADYRFADNSKDYIIKNWKWLDLKPLGNVDTLIFYLSSSDNNQLGMKTPAFFAIDNLKTLDSGLDLKKENAAVISMYPNPAEEWVFFKGLDQNSQLEIIDISGKSIWTGLIDDSGFDVSKFEKGLYFYKLSSDEKLTEGRFIIK